MALTEFELIARYFTTAEFPAGADRGVVLGIGDDAAILRLAPGHELLVSIDTLVSGVHFPPTLPAEDIGYRALAVNLSDLAAMGAEPLWFTLALTLPEVDTDWLQGFSRGLSGLARRAGIALVGGDTTRGPLSITIQVHGTVTAGTALRRDGARVGDQVFVSGNPGMAALGLARIQQQARADDATRAFLRPEPRLRLGQRLRGIASAAIDVSDGLLADAAHIAERSQVGIEIDQARLPLAPLLTTLPSRDEALRLCLSGGDDYELCFSAPSDRAAEIQAIAAATSTPCTPIGRVVSGSGVRCDGVTLSSTGYRHF